MDFWFNESGDIQVSASGDIALTDTQWRDQVQQAYIRVMTDVGDYLLYPTLGASLSQLYGMPQTAATGAFGVSLIENALINNGPFSSSAVTINAVPTGFQTIRFDIAITSGSLQQIVLSLEQNLNLV